VAIHDRDYMRTRQGDDDGYWDWLHGSDFGRGGLAPRGRFRQDAPDEEYDFWTQPITFHRLRLPLMLAVTLFGAFLLPHLTIDGRHWHLWLLP